MADRRSSCSSCGAPLVSGVRGVFDGAAIIGLCSTCSDQQLLAEGGVTFRLQHQLPEALFAVGQVKLTAGAISVLAEGCQHVYEFLLRHVRGDWGRYGLVEDIVLSADEERRGWEATDDDGKINKSNLLNQRDRLMSAYETAAGRDLWIITYLGQNGDTTVLVPEEY